LREASRCPLLVILLVSQHDQPFFDGLAIWIFKGGGKV
jgi:hypothetical protein